MIFPQCVFCHGGCKNRFIHQAMINYQCNNCKPDHINWSSKFWGFVDKDSNVISYNLTVGLCNGKMLIGHASKECSYITSSDCRYTKLMSTSKFFTASELLQTALKIKKLIIFS